jgi:hypothetical protein
MSSCVNPGLLEPVSGIPSLPSGASCPPWIEDPKMSGGFPSTLLSISNQNSSLSLPLFFLSESPDAAKLGYWLSRTERETLQTANKLISGKRNLMRLKSSRENMRSRRTGKQEESKSPYFRTKRLNILLCPTGL